MKTVAAIALAAGIVTFAAALPAAASSSPSIDGPAIRSGTPVSLQLAQVNQTRAINEARRKLREQEKEEEEEIERSGIVKRIPLTARHPRALSRRSH
jgi:hypothetical protein